ncbi:MAG: Kae1-associated serine/threonine protein kinase [Thermoplasmata archaeon]|nr:MAG: Kae1-associated serine/threonine protein kinase [Thermoplasmata archaeon]
MEKLIKRGAEAEIYLATYMGRDVVIKRRIRKKYRIREIDEELRRSRTRKEALLMAEARKAGVAVPFIYDVDVKKMEITMQYIHGKRIKDYLDTMNESDQKEICKKIGESVAFLHKNGIIHGDITTSNLILANEKIYFIDFGLGEKSNSIEKRGVDMHLLMEALKAAHINKQLFEWILKEYEKHVEDGNEVIKKIKEIEKRGRYMVRE